MHAEAEEGQDWTSKYIAEGTPSEGEHESSISPATQMQQMVLPILQETMEALQSEAWEAQDQIQAGNQQSSGPQ